jgi:hypothetical protein
MQEVEITNFQSLSEEDRERSAMALIGELANITKPRDRGLFPQDLNTSMAILAGTIFQQVL